MFKKTVFQKGCFFIVPNMFREVEIDSMVLIQKNIGKNYAYKKNDYVTSFKRKRP
jgi:hypothetical protein